MDAFTPMPYSARKESSQTEIANVSRQITIKKYILWFQITVLAEGMLNLKPSKITKFLWNLSIEGVTRKIKVIDERNVSDVG
ncbi:hypothetical protein ACJIZ3_020985 [Penstemon smallii]|uniref:Uncharacterized protein n=1 Tax=Penstemon smallii TaxID=265156 RepID=A0ABD3SKP0_9LAMI